MSYSDLPSLVAAIQSTCQREAKWYQCVTVHIKGNKTGTWTATISIIADWRILVAVGLTLGVATVFVGGVAVYYYGPEAVVIAVQRVVQAALKTTAVR